MGEIKIVSFQGTPRGWANCDGQFLPINQNQALFSLFGTMYGGNGQTTFALPNLKGRVPIHMGNGHTLGEAAGSSAVTINIQQLATHLHTFNAQDSNADQLTGTGGFLAQTNNAYHAPSNFTTLDPSTVSSVGGSQAHTNQMPFLVLHFIVALQGIFPSQN
jgi:microcystin-dependent protein